jgi:hypothetical protein
MFMIADIVMDGFVDPVHKQSKPTCNNALQLATLPAPRDLWAARTNQSWRLQYNRYLTQRKTDRVLKVKDLVQLDDAGCFKDSTVGGQRSEILPDVLKWCEEFDSLGSLIWMTLPLANWRRDAAMPVSW